MTLSLSIFHITCKHDYTNTTGQILMRKRDGFWSNILRVITTWMQENIKNPDFLIYLLLCHLKIITHAVAVACTLRVLLFNFKVYGTLI